MLRMFLLNCRRNKAVAARYALRLCAQHEKPRACVLIYSKMRLYEEALELALKVEIDLAKTIADQVSHLPYLEIRFY